MTARDVRPPPIPLTRAKARNAALMNQLATPGLGSLLAGRRASGIGQLALAVAGFGMVIGWFVLLIMEMYQAAAYGATPRSVAWLGLLGALVFAVSWIWSLFTSMSLLQEGRENEAGKPTAG